MARLSALAHRLAQGGASRAWGIVDQALERQRAGEDILMLALGDPACPPHPDIVAATTAALAAGRTHYSPLSGERALRQAIAAKAGAAIENVVVLPGAQHGALAAMMILAGPGDEVILSDPYYATYPSAVRTCGAAMVPVAAGPELDIMVETLAAAVTDQTRVIFLNSPANPSGAALTVADYARLSALCASRDIWLLVDEVYADFTYGAVHVGAWQHGPPGRTVVVSSLSKSHAMTGYRLGWAVAPPEVATALAEWSAAALFGVSQFVQDAAIAALALPDSEFAGYRGGFARRAAQVVARANAIPGLSARMPAGGMFVMLDGRAIDEDDQRLAQGLLDRAGVAMVPGSGFGAAAKGHLRISLTPDSDTLDRAFDRIARYRHAMPAAAE